MKIVVAESKSDKFKTFKEVPEINVLYKLYLSSNQT